MMSINVCIQNTFNKTVSGCNSKTSHIVFEPLKGKTSTYIHLKERRKSCAAQTALLSTFYAADVKQSVT